MKINLKRTAAGCMLMICSVFFCTVPYVWAKEKTPEPLSLHGVIVEETAENQKLCVITTGEEAGAYWFLLDGGYYNNKLLGTGLSAFHLVSQIKASPDKKYLAVLSVGEGHPEIEVIDLQELLKNKRYKVLQDIDPYPGGLAMEKWEKGKLIISCDVPLTLRKQVDGVDYNMKRVDPSLMMEKCETFALNPATGKITSITFDKNKFILEHLLRLSSGDKRQRIESALALKALEAKKTLGQIEKALKNEKDKTVIKALEKTIEFLKSKR